MKKFPLSLLILLMLTNTVFAASYPYEGDFPSAMNQYFFLKQGSLYNPDGTLKANPIITANNGALVTCGKQQCLQKTLANVNNGSITFEGKSYRMFINIPEQDTIAYAYKNLKKEYPADLTPYDVPNPMPNLINGGNPTTPAATPVASVANPSQKVFLVKSNNTGNNDSYYIPYLPNASATTHDGLSANVYWDSDHCLFTNLKVLSCASHLVAYGYALTAEKVNQAFVLANVVADGGSSGGAPVVLKVPAPPFNFYKQAINGVYGYAGYLNAIQSIKATYFLQQLNNGGAVKAVTPVWLNQGMYFPIIPNPGFQRNLIRWYTPWGTWNELNNTSGLFVRKNSGGVELPAYQDGSTWKAFPLVVQTWQNNRFAALSKINNIVPLVVTNYIGSESYFPSNLFLPGQAALVPTFDNYQIFDNTGMPNQREVDGFLGLAGENLSDATIFYAGPIAGKGDPGGQANKLFLLGGFTFHQGSTTQYSIRLQDANSVIAALQPKSMAGSVYNIQYYIDSGAGYQKVASFTYQWEPWELQNNGTWGKSPNANEGTFVPQFSLVDSTYMTAVSANEAASFSGASNRVIFWTGVKFNDQVNQLNKKAYFFIFKPISLNASARFLIVFTRLTAPVLTSAKVVPNGGGLIDVFYNQFVSGGSGKYRFVANVPGYSASIVGNFPSKHMFEVRVNKAIQPHAARVSVTAVDEATQGEALSNVVSIGQ